ncbi:MAG: amidohydrolase family protein [Alphaproteobacteria bacterium]|nr:amidohydrolase family protein [Alphaproteobacteria bacterium]
MPLEPTLIVRGGTVVDGTGASPFQADVALAGDRILAVGKLGPSRAEEIDARGLLVIPGFVDVHTHYDAQATWANHLTPSSCNGVTSVLLGNCGVGFAPCEPHQRDMLIRLMEGVEDIPEVVLAAGLPWNWRGFPDYLDALAGRRFDLDVAAQVPHAALRVFVMGERGAAREPATEQDRARMAALAAEGIRAGALGFSTSRTLNHRTVDGQPIPTLRAAEDELAAIARAVGEAGAGWLQMVADFDEELEPEFAMLRRLVRQSGRPMTMTVLERDSRPSEWRRLLEHIAAANAAGLAMTGQVRGRPTSILLGFELSQNPFLPCPSWREVATLPFPQRLAVLRQPAFRARLVGEAPTDRALAYRLRSWERIFPFGDPPNYEPGPQESIAALARERGIEPAEFAYDAMLAGDGRNILYRPLTNYAGGNLDSVREMLAHPHTLVGLGDGGAHVGIICDATDMTHALTHWTRDRPAGGRFPVEWMVKRLTRDNARAIGLADRGVIAAGAKADLNLIDYDRLRLRRPEIVYDLPGGGKRLMQRSDGYVATFVSGVAVYRDGCPTGALPGRLVRGGQAAP